MYSFLLRMRLAVLLLRCAVGFDAFVAQIQGFDRRSNGPYLRDIAGGFRDLNEAFAVDVDYFLDKLKMS